MENLETKDVLKQIESTFKEMTKGFALDAEIKAEIASLKDEYKAIKADTTTPDALAKLEGILQEQGMVLTSLKAAKAVESSNGSITDQVKEIFTSNAQGFSDFKEKKAPLIMELKSAGTMLVGTGSNNVTGTYQLLPTPEMTAGYNPARRNPATFLDAVSVGKTGSARIAYVDQVSPDGTAATVAEGSGKPAIDADYKVSYSSAVKVAAYTKISDEMLDDIDFMAQAVSDELISRVRIAVSGNIYAYLTNGTTNGYSTVNAAYLDYYPLLRPANLFDVLIAAKATIQAGNHEPNTVFINPLDYARLNLTKGTDATYTQPVFQAPNGFLNVAGMTIIPTNAVAVDKYIVCDINKLNVKMYKDLIVEAGWETADFINNLRTIRGECRIHYYVKDNDRTAFLYGDYTTDALYMTLDA